ncbi:papilin-like isoform X2 [Cygnus olor]|uniref:papilin-like isoform X2 n=1 Tax=Cygnus olor TaxID=8869 RepID=UPI001ADDF04B|nr:papilin-like isoform X2 [Cygnus olor]
MSPGVCLLLGLLILGAEPGTAPGEEGAKEGVCPGGAAGEALHVFCLADESCPGAEKCCHDGDVRACTIPSKVHPGYCPGRGAAGAALCRQSCADDSGCGAGEKCCTVGCHRRCAAALPAHPGVCPRLPAGPLRAPCPNACSDDRGCPQDQKCCFTGCGLGCVTPLGNGSSDFPPPGEVDWSLSQAEETHGGEPQKPGTCPRDFTRCLRLEPPLCTNDSVCPGWHKCCPRECRLRCTPPAEEKPGTCPTAAPEGLFYPCSFQCLEDKDCLGSKKCCPLGCGPACLEPLQGEASCGASRSRVPRQSPGSPRRGSGHGAADTCHLPAAPGPCGGRELRFFYNVTSGRCETFPYGGCEGNPNNFGTRAACHRACVGHDKPKPGECPAVLPELAGPCREECEGDSDCPSSQKCCNSSCGHQCLPAAPATLSPVPRGAPAAVPGWQEGTRCWSDRDCSGRDTCCRGWCMQGCGAEGTGKAGFCPASAGLFPSYDCREWCQRDADCPGTEKCCLRGCDYVCLRPAQEKPGICPLTEAAPRTRAPCQASCAEDWQCPGDEKCCSSSRCGRVCLAPERDKPGQCPKVRPRQTSELCTEEDACGHDRDCPRQEKCCFSGCAMRCKRPARGNREQPGPSSAPGTGHGAPGTGHRAQGTRHRARGTGHWGQGTRHWAQGTGQQHDQRWIWGDCPHPAPPPAEHPGECPRAEPCWDPRRRRGSQCLDDSACQRDEKCCSTGCAWACVAVAVPGESQDRAPGQCMEECDTDVQCPQGQRCTSTGCGRVCRDIPGGRVGACPIPRDGGTCSDLCSFDEECPWGQKCCSNGCGHVCTRVPNDAA